MLGAMPYLEVDTSAEVRGAATEEERTFITAGSLVTLTVRIRRRTLAEFMQTDTSRALCYLL